MKPLLACLFALASVPAAHAACTGSSGEAIAPLVELYTSEGCSDCPAADAWMSKLSKETPPGMASFLAFHVTYWDGIGWHDRFGLASSDQRQELRVRLSGKRTTFTPQVMVGRETTLDWRGRRDTGGASRNALAAIRDLQQRHATTALSLQAQAGGDAVEVSLSARRDATDGEAWVWLALYEDGLRSEVKAGENEGMELHHDRVVRALAGPWRMRGAALAQRIELPFPEGLDPRRAGLVLFAESAADASPLQSLQQRLSDCLVPAD